MEETIAVAATANVWRTSQSHFNIGLFYIYYVKSHIYIYIYVFRESAQIKAKTGRPVCKIKSTVLFKYLVLDSVVGYYPYVTNQKMSYIKIL
jgi:hypothetical protein